MANPDNPGDTLTVNPDEAGDGSVSGLELDADGNFTFILDGSGSPLEVRINTPLVEFTGLSFDGALWAQDTDYAVRSGSTILTITADRLVGVDAGFHTLTAQLAGGPVVIEFLLQKPLELSGGSGQNAGIPLPYLALAAVVVLGGAVAALRFRRRNMA